jgi:hypothetical protein
MNSYFEIHYFFDVQTVSDLQVTELFKLAPMPCDMSPRNFLALPYISVQYGISVSFCTYLAPVLESFISPKNNFFLVGNGI